MPEFDSKSFLKNLTSLPGVYQMLDKNNIVLYVGKARNLKKRVSSYFRKQQHPKTSALVSKISHIEIIVTQSEDEALLLEYNLIKKFQPKYNILFRDDKSYSYVIISDHYYPRLFRQRGRINKKVSAFGPYPQSSVVREVVDFLSKVFKLRTCKDAFFKARSRPCLQYQIGRCSAPCVHQISKDKYAEEVRNAILFLSGRSDKLIKALTMRMDQASDQKRYEEAAHYRDQIKAMRDIQSQQSVTLKKGCLDIVVVEHDDDLVCVYLLMIRQGRMLGGKSFYVKLPTDLTSDEVLSNFIVQYYLNQAADLPSEILLGAKVSNASLMQEVINNKANASIKFRVPKQGRGMKWITMAQLNAKEALQSYLSKNLSNQNRLLMLKEALHLTGELNRIECFDVSHTMGEATVASCVVFDKNGSVTPEYRRYNIGGVVAGDDFAALRQAITRRYKKALQQKNEMPGLVIIDGGKGQLRQAIEVFQELSIDGVLLLGVAKGVARKPGLETLFLSGTKQPLVLSSDSPALHLIQQIRDEAHRFAITGHRKRRASSRQHSLLEDIECIGLSRRTKLLKHFGGLQGVLKASIDDLSKVDGISQNLAKRIYDQLH